MVAKKRASKRGVVARRVAAREASPLAILGEIQRHLRRAQTLALVVERVDPELRASTAKVFDHVEAARRALEGAYKIASGRRGLYEPPPARRAPVKAACPQCGERRVLAPDPYGGAPLCRSCRRLNEPRRR